MPSQILTFATTFFHETGRSQGRFFVVYTKLPQKRIAIFYNLLTFAEDLDDLGLGRLTFSSIISF